MRFLSRLVALSSLLLAAAGGGGAAAQIASETVEFPSGSEDVTLRGSLQGAEIAIYEVAAVEGKKLGVGLETSNPANYFNISAPGAKEAAFIGSTQGNYGEVVLSQPGAYRITVYLMRNAARRGEIADYKLSVSLLPASDFADGLSGGPDYWEVHGVGSALRLRAGPSREHGVIGALGNGEVVRNLGCRMSGDARWCRVETLREGQQGWAAGGFLREGTPPREPDRRNLAGNGQRFDATGVLPCAPLAGQPTASCDFGVIRERKPGYAGLWIRIGEGAERYFLFEEGKPVYTNGAGEISVERLGDLQLLRLGEERYEVPDAVIYGG
ncbi:SH3 domain-containing protein [Pelagibius sp. CAU 1746]|uniref:SH3 domain-containing protein n=1 Tax=Pelagibius sp. CAU 1746 TaxID=3140370 RepID=UPI00325AED1D